MPVIIKDIDWNETENTIVLKVPLHGVNSSKVDMLCSKLYVKASFEQYFYEAFLLHPIKPKESTCTFTKIHIIFQLIKCEPQLWGQLESDIPNPEKQQLKQRYIEEEHQRIQQENEDLKTKKSELKRLAVREQMALDTKNRNTIENIKEKEKCDALKSMGFGKPKQIKQTREKTPKISIPPPRISATLTVSFTPREFPTPCRESRLEEENEWLQKQAEARRSVGFISEDLRPEEHNPQFLKSKGDEFLRSGNYLAAISAYSFGIKLNNKFADLYVGRGEAHLRLGNHNKSVQDCTTALDLMKPAVQANLRERACCIGWRGIGLIQLGLLKEGIGELKASLRLVPNEGFSNKLSKAEEMLDESDVQ